jgi:hypothetical protein
MIALLQLSAGPREHAVRRGEVVFLVKVERKGSPVVPQARTAHLWPTQTLSVASEGQRYAHNSTKSAMFR